MSKSFLVYGLLLTLWLGLANTRGWFIGNRLFPRGCTATYGGGSYGGYGGFGGGYHK